MVTIFSARSLLEPTRIGAYIPRLHVSFPQQRSALTTRKKMGRWGFQPKSRYTNFRPVRITWHGKHTNAFTKVLNSNPSTHPFSSRRCSAQRPAGSGNASAHHAFRFHARAVITMYAQLLSNVSEGAFSARTPLCNCDRRFSWLQRSLAVNTTSDAALVLSLVI